MTTSRTTSTTPLMAMWTSSERAVSASQSFIVLSALASQSSIAKAAQPRKHDHRCLARIVK